MIYSWKSKVLELEANLTKNDKVSRLALTSSKRTYCCMLRRNTRKRNRKCLSSTKTTSRIRIILAILILRAILHPMVTASHHQTTLLKVTSQTKPWKKMANLKEIKKRANKCHNSRWTLIKVILSKIVSLSTQEKKKQSDPSQKSLARSENVSTPKIYWTLTNSILKNRSKIVSITSNRRTFKDNTKRVKSCTICKFWTNYRIINSWATLCLDHHWLLSTTQCSSNKTQKRDLKRATQQIWSAHHSPNNILTTRLTIWVHLRDMHKMQWTVFITH